MHCQGADRGQPPGVSDSNRLNNTPTRGQNPLRIRLSHYCKVVPLICPAEFPSDSRNKRIHYATLASALDHGGQKERWIARLIVNLAEWKGRRYGEINYYLTQFLTGHGCFNDYLNMIGKVKTITCQCCDTLKGDAHYIFLRNNFI